MKEQNSEESAEQMDERTELRGKYRTDSWMKEQNLEECTEQIHG